MDTSNIVAYDRVAGISVIIILLKVIFFAACSDCAIMTTVTEVNNLIVTVVAINSSDNIQTFHYSIFIMISKILL